MTFVAMVLMSGCVDSQNVSIQIPFAILSSDELQEPQPGQPCYYIPVTQAGGQYRNAGMVELDPNLNPAVYVNPDSSDPTGSGGYVIALQVENYLDQTTPTDSNGTPTSGPQRNNFLITDAIVQYIPQQNYMEGSGMPTTAKFLTSGLVAPGGQQSATAVLTNTLSPDAITAMSTNLLNLETSQNVPSPGGDVVLEIYLEGTLGSGEPVQSGTFYFPLHVCYDCGGGSPLPVQLSNGNTVPACMGLTVGTLGVVNHGPCCAFQDFTDVCLPCGLGGEPACSPPQLAGGFPCNTNADCAGTGMPTCNGGICNCKFQVQNGGFVDVDPAGSQCSDVFGSGNGASGASTCVPGQSTVLIVGATQTPSGFGVCSAGCAPGFGFPKTSTATTVQGFEPCTGYPNDGVGITGVFCQ
ncbi:MAG: hypothetical protein ACYDCL_18670 [Myxococcales bacterium]